MEANAMNILVVDDEPAIRTNLVRLLTLEGHTVTEASDGRIALTAMREKLPDLIFTDVQMPHLDGYDFCRAVKSDPDMRVVPVIFISGRESVEARMEAFSAGGEDFIVKPFQTKEVLHKVSSAARILAEAKALRAQAEVAQSTAFVAMKWAAEIGVVLDFIRRSLATAQRDELATRLIEATQAFGTDCVVLVRGEINSACLSARGRDIPLEQSVMQHVRSQGRIFQFQSRSVFNYDSVSILVNNMPVEDEERCGRLRDHLALLAEAADARNRAIELDLHRTVQAAGVRQALGAAEQAMRAVAAGQRDERRLLEEGMARLQQNLARVFVGCGLRESQEDSIVAVITEHLEENTKLLDHAQHAGEELDRLTVILGELASRDSAVR